MPSAPPGRLAESRDGHTATLLPDGRVLIVGGQSGRFGPETGPDGEWRNLASAEFWDPSTEAFIRPVRWASRGPGTRPRCCLMAGS